MVRAFPDHRYLPRGEIFALQRRGLAGSARGAGYNDRGWLAGRAPNVCTGSKIP